MRRLTVCLVTCVLAGPAAAEQVAPPRPSAPMIAQAVAEKAPEKKPPTKKPAVKSPPARDLFGTVDSAAPLASRAIGSYAKGCLAGGSALPITGPNWQVMRLSRNRNWGHPRLLDYMERLASDARALDGWPGLLVGDMAQPRGGPMLNGHSSHQIGLDADIWLTPMPDRILTAEEREDVTAVSMLKDPFTVDPDIWTPEHTKLIRRAATYPQVARIFVHPAIKKKLCETAGKDRAWLRMVRPWWNHYYHFHVRLSCPPGLDGCENQSPVGAEDGCGAELKNWYAMLKSAAIAAAKPAKPAKPGAKPWKGKPPLSMAQLPRECGTVLKAGGHTPVIADAATMPAALRIAAGKDAGPPLPKLDQAALEALVNGGSIGGMPLPERNPKR